MLLSGPDKFVCVITNASPTFHNAYPPCSFSPNLDTWPIPVVAYRLYANFWVRCSIWGSWLQDVGESLVVPVKWVRRERERQWEQKAKFAGERKGPAKFVDDKNDWWLLLDFTHEWSIASALVGQQWLVPFCRYNTHELGQLIIYTSFQKTAVPSCVYLTSASFIKI